MTQKKLKYFNGLDIITLTEGEDNVETITHNEGNNWVIVVQNNQRKTIVSTYMEYTENMPLYSRNNSSF